MKRVLVCAEDAFFIVRIERFLSNQSRAYDVHKTPIRKDELQAYSFIIIHSSWRLTSLYGFIENVVLNQSIPVFFIGSTVSFAPFLKLNDTPYLVLIDESKMDVELPMAYQIVSKMVSFLEKFIEKNNKSSNQADRNLLMNQCKAVLMDKGMSEETAHKTILKRAMDDQISKFDACSRILNEISKEQVE